MKSRISRWNKWDLHLHTRASKKKKRENEYFGSGYSFDDEEVQEFVKKVFCDNQSKLVAITDHDYFDAEQFLKIKEEVNELSISNSAEYCVLPGVECDVFFKVDSKKTIVTDDDVSNYIKSDRVHLVLIFNDGKWDKEQYNKLHSILEEKYPNDDPIYIGDLLSKFTQNKFEFVALPHYDKTNGIETALPDYVDGQKVATNMEMKITWLLSGYFPLLDSKVKDFIDLKVTEFYNQLQEKHGFPIPIILTSDNHDYRQYDDSLLSWFKATPSFKGLKMCCSDYQMRVKCTPDVPKSTYISKVIIDGSADLTSNCEIELSDNLNCVIGGRSSGKSLLLKKMIQSSGSNAVDDELKKYKRYNSGMSVKLIAQDGSLYKGKPEYISQGSIIQKYINSDDNSNLASDFKEYFPKSVNFDSILKEKEEIRLICLRIDNNIQFFSKLSKELSNISLSGYLKISKIQFKNTISNKVLLANYDNAQIVVGNLKKFIAIIKENRFLIEPFKNLNSNIDDLIDRLEKEYAKSFEKLQQYEKIKKASIKFVYGLEMKAEGYDKKEKTQVGAIGSLSNSILEWCTKYQALINDVQLLKQRIDSLKQTETYSNEIPSFRFVIKITNTLKISDIFQLFIERVKTKEIRETSKNFYQLIDKTITQDYELYVTKNLTTSLNEKLDSSYKIEYLIYEKGELINNMSEGRKVSVFLNILLNKNDSIEPLIIDQPEDDMDNNDIYSILVSSLRSRKAGRQIILATHDSNIVVNGDAENIIFASKTNKKAKINYAYGALEYEDENINIQKIICDTLEGGEEAFINRAFKYDLDKTKIYKWRE